MSGKQNSLPAVYQDRAQVQSDLTAMTKMLEEVLPSRVDPDRFIRVAARAIVTNPTLMQCTRVSILESIHTAAQLGLEPSGLLGSAYLVPYRVSGTMTCNLIPGYRGLIDLARRSGEIDAIWANVVRQRDTFRLRQGDDPGVDHEPFIADPKDDREDRDPGPFLGAYMVAVLQGGTKQVEWMSYDDIEAIRKRSKAASSGPWVTDWSEMARKTVVRRGSKYLPMTTDFARALSLDEEAERRAERPQTSGDTPKGTAMLLERARKQAQDAPGPEEAPEPDPGPQEAPSEAPGPSESVTPLRVVQTEDGPSLQEAPDTAREFCGALGPNGTCTRMPGHNAGHSNEDGKWPQKWTPDA